MQVEGSIALHGTQLMQCLCSIRILDNETVSSRSSLYGVVDVAMDGLPARLNCALLAAVKEVIVAVPARLTISVLLDSEHSNGGMLVLPTLRSSDQIVLPFQAICWLLICRISCV